MTIGNLYIGSNMLLLAYLIFGIIYCIYYWYRYYDHDYKKLKMTGDVEDGMACNLMIYIVIFWPICFVLDMFNLIKNLIKSIKNFSNNYE